MVVRKWEGSKAEFGIEFVFLFLKFQLGEFLGVRGAEVFFGGLLEEGFGFGELVVREGGGGFFS
jgi:hypothetical protein